MNYNDTFAVNMPLLTGLSFFERNMNRQQIIHIYHYHESTVMLVYQIFKEHFLSYQVFTLIGCSTYCNICLAFILLAKRIPPEETAVFILG